MTTPSDLTHEERSRRRDRRVWLGILLISLVAYAPCIGGVCFGAWPFANDGASLFAPWRTFARQALQLGTLPLWNPYSFCGIPFLSNTQTATLYPPNLVYWIFPLSIGFLLDALMHQLILAFGLYTLARALGLSRTAAWLAMAVFALGGAVSGHMYAGHMSWHAARGYIPWELWAWLGFLRTGRRRYAALLAGVVVLQIFAGYPPLVLLGAGLCCGLFIARTTTLWLRRRAGQWGPLLPAGWPLFLVQMGFVVVAVAAVNVLPMQDQSRLSVHGSGMSFKDVAELSGTWRSLLRLLIPEFFGGNWLVQWSVKYGAWEEAAYLGILPLVLAVGAPWWARRRADGALPPAVPWLWALMFSSWLLALGDNTPLYHFLFSHSPLFRLTRYPVRWLEVGYLCGALLAGVSFQATLLAVRATPARVIWLQRVVMALTLPCIGLSLWMSSIPAGDNLWTHKAQWNLVVNDPSLHGRLAEYLRSAAVLQPLVEAIVAAVLGVTLLAWLRAAPATRPRVTKGLIALAMLDVLIGFWRYMTPLPEVDLRDYVRWPATLAREYRPEQRWDSQVHWYALNQNLPLGLDAFNGYDALSGRRFFDFVDYLEGRKFWRDSYVPMLRPPLLRVAAVTHSITWAKEPLVRRGDPPLTPIGRQGLWRLWRHDGAWPRVYLSRQVRRAAESAQLPLLDHLSRGAFGGAAQPVVVAPDKFLDLVESPLTSGDRVAAWRRTLNTVSVDAVTTAPSVLVQADSLYPGWQAWVNGQPSALEYGNSLFRAVRVPSGASHTTFVYEPQTFRFSLYVSLCGLALCAAVVAAHSRRPDHRTA